jgi:hypothetical protein
MKIIDISVLLPPPPITEYAILIDRSILEITEFSEKHPKCIVIPFYTKTVAEVPDCSVLTGHYILRPYYIGNLSPLKQAADEVLRITLAELRRPFFEGGPEHELSCISDDRWRADL